MAIPWKTFAPATGQLAAENQEVISEKAFPNERKSNGWQV
jgi:hypothetical protein